MRSGVGAVCPLTRAVFFLDLEAMAFFFLALFAVEEDPCEAAGRPPPDTRGAVLARSTAPKRIDAARLLIAAITAREQERRRRDTPCRTAHCRIDAGL